MRLLQTLQTNVSQTTTSGVVRQFNHTSRTVRAQDIRWNTAGKFASSTPCASNHQKKEMDPPGLEPGT